MNTIPTASKVAGGAYRLEQSLRSLEFGEFRSAFEASDNGIEEVAYHLAAVCGTIKPGE